MVLLERSIRFRPIAVAEIAESVVFFVFAIVGVRLGYGIWAIAVASIARAIAGTALVLICAGERVTRPRWSTSLARELFVFGARFRQEIVHARLARDGSGRQWIIASDHHGANAHRPQVLKALAHSSFDDIC